MKELILITTLVLSFGCASSPKDDDVQDIRTDMAHINNIILGKFKRKKTEIELKDLNNDQYIKLIKKFQKKSDKEYVDFYEEYQPEVKFKTTEKDFGMCLKSVKAKVFLCDAAYTGTSETLKEKSRDLNQDLDEEINKLILKGE